MDKIINIFILAAGLGERLHPITYHIPKPLLPILGKPVLDSILEKVSTLPVNKIGLNLYHKKEVIENWVSQSASYRLELFPEDPLLGTGGALKNAEAFLSKSTFLTHNSDIFSNIDLAKLLQSHYSSGNLVTLAVCDSPKFNNLVLDGEGFLKGIEKTHSQQHGEMRQSAFTGIAVYEPEFLKFLPAGVSSIVDMWLNVIAAGYRVGTLDVSGCYWSDIGTLSSYCSTVFDILRADGEMIYIHPSIKDCKHVSLGGYVVIEKGSVLNCRVTLKNCILLPGSRIGIKDNKNNPPIPPRDRVDSTLLKGGEGGLLIENCIIGPGFKIDLRESEIMGLPRTPAAFLQKQEGGVRGLSEDADALLIGAGGSDRTYHRLKRGNRTVVVMRSSSHDPDFQRQIEYTRFFFRHSIPVPELLKTDPNNMSAVFEDLGDISLYSWLKCPHDQEQVEKIYKQVIDILILIHTVATEYVLECKLLKKRIFDYEHFRWESAYFIEKFVESIRNISVKNPSALNKEFHSLALKADSFPKTVIHRDFQSQNIMITKERPRLIDYQGARIGPPAYDVVSILWDPYYRLKSDMRESLLNYYIGKMKNLIPPNPPIPPFRKGGLGGILKGGRGDFQMSDGFGRKFNERDFRKTLLPCRLQRHMQALGAFGFLSTVKGKKYFLKFVPEALRFLKKDLSLSKKEYPELYNLVMGL